MFHRTLTTTALTLLAVASARAADTINLFEGKPILGKVVEVTASEVTIEQGPVKKKVSINEIYFIAYDDESSVVGQARQALLSGNLPRAQDLLARAKVTQNDRKEVVQEVEYLRAVVAARMALAGSGKRSDAGKLLLDFEKQHPDSCHYLQICEALGDMFLASNKPEQAEAYYGKLAAAPWPNYQMRGGMLLGRALAARKEHAKAIAKFDEVIATRAEGKDAAEQRLHAMLGKALSLAATRKIDEAIKLCEEVIDKSEKEDIELSARAYNALGQCYLLAGKDKDARVAFLHTDLLFKGVAEQHAEALANLGPLWLKFERADLARSATNRLKEQYPFSRWLQK